MSTYALIDMPAVLDLCRDRSVIGQFLDKGFDVYLIGWGSPGEPLHYVTVERDVRGSLPGESGGAGVKSAAPFRC